MRSEASTAVAWHFGTMGALLILVAAAFAIAWTAFGVKLLPIPLVYVLAIIWIADELPPLFWRGYKAALPKRGVYGRVSPVFWLIAIVVVQGLSWLVGALYVKRGGTPAYGFAAVFAAVGFIVAVFGVWRARAFRQA